MSLLDSLPHTVTHKRRKYSNDEYIGNKVEETTLSTGVKAWVQNANMSEVLEYQKRDQRITHKVFYSSEPSIRPGDIIRVTAGPSFVGKELNFQSMTDRSAGLGVLFKAVCDEENNIPASFN